MNVIFIPDVLVYFEDLVFTLYHKRYFSFLETSKKYVEELVDDILTTLPDRLCKPAPEYFNKYGSDSNNVFKRMEFFLFILWSFMVRK